MSGITSADSKMLNGPIGKTYLSYSIPWTLALLLLSSAGIVDGLFVARCVGPTALAALNLIMPVYSLLIGMGFMCASGGAVCVVRYLGQDKVAEARAMFTKSMLIMILISIILAGLSIVFAQDIIDFMGAEGELGEQAYIYLLTIMFFAPFFTGSIALSYFVRVDERPRLASLGLSSTAISNIILDYIFIYELQMGVMGAALGSGIACVISIFIMSSYFFSKNARLKFTLKLGKFKEVIFAYWNGLSEFINEASYGIIAFIINYYILHNMGEAGITAYTIINYIAWIVMTISYGLSDTLAPLVSINHTTNRLPRVYAFVIYALYIIVSFGILSVVVSAYATEHIVNLFIVDNQEITDITIAFMGQYKYMFLFIGFNMAMTSTLTGLNRAGLSALVASSRSLILPLILVLLLTNIFGVIGVFVAISISEFITALIAMYIMYRICKTLK